MVGFAIDWFTCHIHSKNHLTITLIFSDLALVVTRSLSVFGGSSKPNIAIHGSQACIVFEISALVNIGGGCHLK